MAETNLPISQLPSKPALDAADQLVVANSNGNNRVSGAALIQTVNDQQPLRVNSFNTRKGDVVLQSQDLNGLSGSGLTGIGTGTGGVINTGSTTIGADSDADGVGVIALQTRGQTRQQISNDGALELFGQTAPALAAAGKARTYYDLELSQLMLSQDGGAYVPVLGGVAELVNVRSFKASGAKTSTPININFGKTFAAITAGATVISLIDATNFAIGEVVKLTGGGPGGGVYRGYVVNKALNDLTVYPAIQTAVAAGASLQHGDNNVWTRTSGVIAAAATVIPVVDASSFKAGQGIYIASAGAASGGGFAPFIGTVQSVAGNNITLTAGITTAITANAIVMHDDTAAFNAAVAAAAALGTATIVIPAGVYMLNGPGQGAGLSRILMPATSNMANPLTIRFQGAPRTVPTFPAFLANHGITTNGTILQSDGAGGAIVGGEAGADFTLVDAQFFDLTFRAYDNPKISGVNGRRLIQLRIENCMFDTGSQAGAATQPTDTTNFAFATGLTANGGQQVIRNVWSIGGWYSGMDLAEHAVIEGDTVTFGNYYGVRLDSSIHPIYIGRLGVHECARGLTVLSSLRYRIGAMVIERRWSSSPLPAWLQTDWDIYDPNSYGSGEVAYTIREGSTNDPSRSLLINGAVDLQRYPLATGKCTNFGVPFSDSFDDNSTETAWWTIGSQFSFDGSARGTVIEQNNRLEIAPQASVTGSKYRGYVTKDTFNLFGAMVTVKVSQVASNGATTIFSLLRSPGNRFSIYVTGTLIQFYRIYRGSSTLLGSLTYNAVNHLYWRFRESVNYVLTAEVSPDGSTWTQLGQEPLLIMYLNQVRISLEAGTDSSIAVPGTAFFDSFSITPPAGAV